MRTWLFVGSLGLRFLTPRVMFKEVVEVQRNDSRWLKICILLLSCNAFNTKLCVRIMISPLTLFTRFFSTLLSWFCNFGHLPFQFFLFIFFVKYSHVCLQSQLTESRYIKQQITFYKISSPLIYHYIVTILSFEVEIPMANYYMTYIAWFIWTT